jgi:hypothetical protein
MKIYCFLLMLLVTLLGYSRNDTLPAIAVRTTTPPVIDGHLEDIAWQNAIAHTHFVQYDPFQGQSPRFQTVVYILYDDEALYFGAMMFDNSPDSILKQLGDRDSDLNADDIVFQFDPFNNNQDAYYFRVTASGVQSDWKRKDGSYNAVWHSRTAIHNNGWSVEVKIPFSSIRIPPVDSHKWAFQVTRNIRRYREFSKLAPEKKGVDNDMVFWASMTGISEIEPPVRLSLTPYFSIFAERSNGVNSVTPFGGLDLKYGINESFTLDLTLLPDFSQVKSDDVIKNLSAFEVNFSEQRPFFLESMDLFRLGGLFYSRRIGKFPTGYYSPYENLQEDEEVISNPASVSLINSFKITGQTSGGLSVGVLNAITDQTKAEIQSADGTIRHVETEPMSNYNVFVMRQALKHNSNIYLINTNLLRKGKHETANVTGAGLKLYTPSNKYALTLNGSSSSRFLSLNETGLNKAGYAWNMTMAKVRGNFQFHYYYQMKNDRYNINDMGINYTNDDAHNEVQTSYRFFDPFWKLLRLNLSSSLWRSHRISTGKPTGIGVSTSASTTTVKHLSMWTTLSWNFAETFDYYEPRSRGYYYIAPQTQSMSFGFSSDYRRPFALDGNASISQKPETETFSYSVRLSPIFRASNHLQFNFSSMLNKNSNARGFAGKDTVGTPIFGNRDVTTTENSFSGKYIFRNNLSLSLRIRHYWSKGEYDRFFILEENGRLSNASEEIHFNDFNFNSFLVDLVFNWEFAPGSNLTLVWKNSIIDEQMYAVSGFGDNFISTFDHPQTNMLSLKFIYFLDYHTIKTKIKK